MNVSDVELRVELIRNAASGGADTMPAERARVEEFLMFRDVITAIAYNQCADPRSVCLAALEARKIGFLRG